MEEIACNPAVTILKLRPLKPFRRHNTDILASLGKQAGEAMGELADLTIPHPYVVLKHGDKSEVFRKASNSKRGPVCPGNRLRMREGIARRGDTLPHP